MDWDLPFTIAAILHEEATELCRYSPLKDVPKRSSASDSLLTRSSKKGEGNAHCVVLEWPIESTPSAWGLKNHGVLLDEELSPSIWQELLDVDPTNVRLINRIKSTDLLWVSSRDDGNEEQY